MTGNYIPALQCSSEYFYGLSLVIGAVVNFLLAGMLAFDPDNFIYYDMPRYLRSRYLTAFALVVFGIGFFLHWFFMPRLYSPLAASALSLTYFHVGGMLFSMSHTGLVDRHYLTRRVVLRDVPILIVSIAVYVMSALFVNQTLQYIGFALFFLHVSFLSWTFYRHFHRIYAQLGNYANELPNDTDHDIRWLFFSCHLIILFGIGSIVITLLFPNDTLPFTILMFVGIVIFAYIYKALDGFSALVFEAEKNLQNSEDYLASDRGKKGMRRFLRNREKREPLSAFPVLSGFFKQW